MWVKVFMVSKETERSDHHHMNKYNRGEEKPSSGEKTH